MSDVPTYEHDVLLSLADCTDEYDDTEVSVPLSYVAFSSSLALGRHLSQFWVVESACSINLAAYRSDFATFAPPSAPSRVGGVGFDVKGRGSLQIIFGWHLLRPFTARSMHYTAPIFYLILLSTLAASSLSVGCIRRADVNYFFLLTLTLAYSWCPQEWVC
jgi:hypothetical protein